MPGTRSWQTITCISTVSGYRVVSRGMAIPTTCLMNVSEIVRRRGRTVCASSHRQRRSLFWPIRNSWPTRDSRFATKLTTAFNSGIFLFSADAPIPQFKECARHPKIAERGYVLYCTSQCPFNAKYVPVLEAVAKEQGVPFKAIHLQSKSEAQNAPTPITTYAFFRDGEYLTNEQMNDKRFMKVING